MRIINVNKLKNRYNKYEKDTVLYPDHHFKNRLVRNNHVVGYLGDLGDAYNHCLTAFDIAFDLNITYVSANTLLKKMDHNVRFHRIKVNHNHYYKILGKKRKNYLKATKGLIIGKYCKQRVIGLNHYIDFIRNSYNPTLSKFEHRIFKRDRYKRRYILAKKIATMSQDKMFIKENLKEYKDKLFNIYKLLKDHYLKNHDYKIDQRHFNDLKMFIHFKKENPKGYTDINFIKRHRDIFTKYKPTYKHKKSKLSTREHKDMSETITSHDKKLIDYYDRNYKHMTTNKRTLFKKLLKQEGIRNRKGYFKG